MKHLYLLLFVLSTSLHSQSLNEKMHSITYIASGKYYKNWESPSKEYTRLLVDKNKALYQIYNIMCLDSLKVKGLETSSDRNKYFSFNNYTIEIADNSLNYTEYIAGNTYSYKENLNFKWNLMSDSKNIYGYDCKKATLDYGGRSWTAWYALDIPIPYGPYKFGGLPGLIVEMYDTDRDFTFEIYGNTVKEKKPLEKLYKTEKSLIINTDHKKFNRLKYKYNSLTMGEKSKFRGSSNTNSTLKQLDENGNELKFRETVNSSNLNFIERVDF